MESKSVCLAYTCAAVLKAGRNSSLCPPPLLLEQNQNIAFWRFFSLLCKLTDFVKKAENYNFWIVIWALEFLTRVVSALFSLRTRILARHVAHYFEGLESQRRGLLTSTSTSSDRGHCFSPFISRYAGATTAKARLQRGVGGQLNWSLHSTMSPLRPNNDLMKYLLILARSWPS